MHTYCYQTVVDRREDAMPRTLRIELPPEDYVEAWGGSWPSRLQLDNADTAFMRRRLDEERGYMRQDMRDIRLAGQLAQLDV